VGWLSKTVAELIRDHKRDFCRTFRMGNTVHVAQWRVNSHGRFLEVSEYGAEGWQSFIIILEGRARSVWGSCGVQMRKVAHYFEEDVTGSKYIKKHEDFLLMPRTEEKRRRSFTEDLVGKVQTQETALVSGGMICISGTQRKVYWKILVGRKSSPTCNFWR
jgi:hypothetical protein